MSSVHQVDQLGSLRVRWAVSGQPRFTHCQRRCAMLDRSSAIKYECAQSRNIRIGVLEGDRWCGVSPTISIAGNAVQVAGLMITGLEVLIPGNLLPLGHRGEGKYHVRALSLAYPRTSPVHAPDLHGASLQGVLAAVLV